MADTASLVVRVTGQGISAVQRELGGLSSAAKSAAASVGLVASAGATLNKLVATARQTDVLRAGLVTMTGSAENATAAFAELEKFAAKTPYTLDQSVEAFTKLVALGLNPSQKAIESYGNTAAAMGKSMTQMIEAVADASTGEFERLKEFGIKAKSQGDQVSFTFQGVTTTVGKNAAEIEGYLQGLGENQFAGAMANRMATLDGALSNLQDSWDGLFRAVSTAGTGEAIAEQVRNASAALSELTDMISSGEMMGYIDAWGGQWESTFSDMRNGLDQLDTFFTDTISGWGVTADDTSSFMSDAFWQFPANMRALVQIATVEIAGFVDKAKAYGVAAASALNPFAEGDWEAQLNAELATINSNVSSLASGFLAQRDAAISAMDSQIGKAKEMRAEFDKVKAPLDLGQFKVGGSGATGGESPADKAKAEAASKREEAEKAQAQRYIERLAQANMTELELIKVQEEEKALILADYRNRGLITEAEYQAALTEARVTAANTRADLEIEAAQRIEQENQRIFDAEMAAIKEKEKAEQKKIDDGITAGREMTNNLKSSLGEQSGIYKAAAVTMTMIDTYKAAQGAYAAMASIPYVGPALGIAAAGAAMTAGMAQVAAIRGAREQGGQMIGGSAYQMAERGQAEVIVPSGNSRARTAKQMRDIMGQESGGATSIVIVNQTTGRIDSVEQETDDEGRIRIIVREEVAAGLINQDSQIAKARRQTRGQAGY